MRTIFTIMLISFSTTAYGNELFGLKLNASATDLAIIGDEYLVEYVVHGRNQNGDRRNLYEVEVTVPFPDFNLDYFLASYDKTSNRIESVQGWKEDLKSLSTCNAMAETIASNLSRNLNVSYSRENIGGDTYFYVITDLKKEGYSLHVVCLDKFNNDMPSLAVEMYSKKFKIGYELGLLKQKLLSYIE